MASQVRVLPPPPVKSMAYMKPRGPDRGRRTDPGRSGGKFWNYVLARPRLRITFYRNPRIRISGPPDTRVPYSSADCGTGAGMFRLGSYPYETQSALADRISPHR